MPSDKISVRLGPELLSKLDNYVAEHGLERAAVIRLALIKQMERKPPKKLPEGVERVGRNPNAADAGRLGAKTRWEKPSGDEGES